jgi:prepilin-type N-terminal cleavage/methylation domain-containing protein
LINHNLKQAFTLLEVLISVVILSTSIILVLKIHSQTRKEIEYIVQRNKYALSDSLFVSNNIFRYHKDTKTAYEILQDKFQIDNLDSKRILQNIKRTIYIPETYNTENVGIENIPNAQIKEIKIKDMFSSYYFHFEINSI